MIETIQEARNKQETINKQAKLEEAIKFIQAKCSNPSTRQMFEPRKHAFVLYQALEELSQYVGKLEADRAVMLTELQTRVVTLDQQKDVEQFNIFMTLAVADLEKKKEEDETTYNLFMTWLDGLTEQATDIMEKRYAAITTSESSTLEERVSEEDTKIRGNL